ncbi:MAG TPA: glycosyltransferase family 2 protein [Thermoanaerobaculia bacterium]|nr:glycosyltransferase family 2 protein [Thermoanaerobaculia bacterium]
MLPRASDPPREASAPPTPTSPEISVVVPVYEESGAILPLLNEVMAALQGRRYEIVVVDDGSGEATRKELLSASQFVPHLRVVTHARNFGQSAAILTGVRNARGAWVATIDGDGQNDPRDLVALLAARAESASEPVLVCGVRRHRRDRWSKRVASRLANAVRGRLLRDGVHDSACGLKLFRRDVFLRLPAFDHMHRFLPALAQAQGLRIHTVQVAHRPRTAGRSQYGIVDRLLVGIVDLFGVWWLQRRRISPSVVGSRPVRQEAPIDQASTT